MSSTTLKDIPLQEQPRIRFLENGPEQMTVSELMAIILKTGTKEYSAKDLANNIINKINNISELKDISIQTLTNIHGIGLVKAIELKAAIELGRRVYYENEITSKINFNNPEKIYKHFKYIINNNPQEHFYCLYLDNKKRLITKRLLFIGTINISIVHPREIFKYAYLASASAIICVHNHPSGDPEPSDEDIELTKSLVKIGQIQGIKILDHIIIGNNKYYSFYEKKKI
ncbi:MAG: DNA repair protein RadC [Bacilli bacterium]|jgi:DNA repair protein RadC|nr:DNA repair protein RadC [Bacilli bacterium]